MSDQVYHRFGADAQFDLQADLWSNFKIIAGFKAIIALIALVVAVLLFIGIITNGDDLHWLDYSMGLISTVVSVLFVHSAYNEWKYYKERKH